MYERRVDYGIYAVSVTYITAHFFPGQYGTLLALATFAFSFLVRPLGGLFWGPMGGRLGRKSVLAPILLVLLRAVQGFSSGGEYGGAATFMAEYSPDKRRGFFGSFLEFGTMAGIAGGSAIVLAGEVLLGTEAMMEWGWRIPFLIAGPLGIIGLYLRSKLSESPVYEELEEKDESSSVGEGFRQLFFVHWKQILIMGGLVTTVNVVNYTLLTYMPTYLGTVVEMDAKTTLTVMLLAQVAMLLAIPVAGSLSDRVGRKPMWYASLIGQTGSSLVPAFYMMGACVIGFIAALAMKETKGASLRGTEVPETGAAPVFSDAEGPAGARS